MGSLHEGSATRPRSGRRARSTAGGARLDTLVADGRPAYGQNNGLHVVLQPDGQLRSWVDEAPAPAPRPDGGDRRNQDQNQNDDQAQDHHQVPDQDVTVNAQPAAR